MDQLAEIKRRWSPEVDGDITDTDIEWLIAQVEKFRPRDACCSGIFCAVSIGDQPDAPCVKQADRRVVAQVLQEVADLPPWAYTFKERPDDLLEVRAADLDAILRAALDRPEST